MRTWKKPTPTLRPKVVLDGSSAAAPRWRMEIHDHVRPGNYFFACWSALCRKYKNITQETHAVFNHRFHSLTVAAGGLLVSLDSCVSTFQRSSSGPTAVQRLLRSAVYARGQSTSWCIPILVTNESSHLTNVCCWKFSSFLVRTDDVACKVVHPESLTPPTSISGGSCAHGRGLRGAIGVGIITAINTRGCKLRTEYE